MSIGQIFIYALGAGFAACLVLIVVLLILCWLTPEEGLTVEKLEREAFAGQISWEHYFKMLAMTEKKSESHQDGALS